MTVGLSQSQALRPGLQTIRKSSGRMMSRYCTDQGTVLTMLEPYLQLPALYTAPLCEDFTTDGDWLLKVVDLAWRTPESPEGIDLDPWQKWLIRHALETYPPGHPRAGQLRYRQVLASVGRQNGKSVLGAIFGLYGLLREAGALVIGVASSRDQASIIYERTMLVINSNPSLKKRFQKLTETRGIKSNDGSEYLLKASKGAALQGLPISLGMADELHITKPEVWRAMVNGTASRKSGIVIGVTTAGDDQSVLLVDLYETAQKAADGDPRLERFGAFIWEAPEDRVPEDDETLTEFLLAANPALAAGRLDLETAISDIRTMPPADIIRYRLNRFTGSSAAFMSGELWAKCKDEIPTLPNPVFAIDATAGLGFVTITASQKLEGVVYTEVVASIPRASVPQLLDICVRLAKHNPSMYVVNGFSLSALGNELKKRGYEVGFARAPEEVNASAMLYSKVINKAVKHAGDDLLSMQLPRTVRRNKGESYVISKKDSSVEIDAVMATAVGVLFADQQTEKVMQLFI